MLIEIFSNSLGESKLIQKIEIRERTARQIVLIRVERKNCRKRVQNNPQSDRSKSEVEKSP